MDAIVSLNQVVGHLNTLGELYRTKFAHPCSNSRDYRKFAFKYIP